MKAQVRRVQCARVHLMLRMRQRAWMISFSPMPLNMRFGDDATRAAWWRLRKLCGACKAGDQPLTTCASAQQKTTMS
jgi:hypothetical protein